MKQKLISLLTLLLCVCSGAWAYEGASGDVTFFKVNNGGRANKLADGCYAYRGSSGYSWSDGNGIKTQSNTGGIIVFYLSGTSNVTVDIKHTESKNAHNVTASFYTLTESAYSAFYGITSETAVTFSLPGEATYTKTIEVGATASTFSGTQQLNAGYYAVVCNGANSNTYHNAMHFETADARDEAPISWSAASYTAVIGESNTFPTLSNTEDLTVTYSSSNASAATINASGDITLNAVGSTTITATYTSPNAQASYKTTSVSYTLTVSNLVAQETKFWDFSDWETGSFAVVKSDDNIELVAASGKGMEIASNAFQVVDDESFTKRLKLNGTGASTSRYIHFRVKANSKISIYQYSGNAERVLKADAGSFGGTNIISEGTTEYKKSTGVYTGTTDTDIYVYSSNNNISIYGIKVEPLKCGVPTFSPNGGSIEEGVNVTVTSTDASSIKYAWTADDVDTPDSWSSADATDDAIVVTVPNAAANTPRLHAYGIKSGYTDGDNAYVDFTITGADNIAPELTGKSVVDNATGIAIEGSMTLTFNENVRVADASKVTLTGGGATISSVTAMENVVTIAYTGLAYNTTYTLAVASGAITDLATAQNAYVGTSFSFTTIKESMHNPTISGLGYFVGSQTVSISSDVVGATITYSLDGENYSTYTEPFEITASKNVYAKATHTDYTGEGSTQMTMNIITVPGELEDVTASTTWDFTTSDSDGLKPSENQGNEPIPNTQLLSDVTVYSGINKAAQITFIKPQRYDVGGYVQAHGFVINTTVSGKLSIKYQGGKNGNTRLLMVNGIEKSSNNSTNSSKTTSDIIIPAGTTIVYGYDVTAIPNAVNNLRFQKIVFTASPTVTVGAKGYATYVNSETALDFTGKSIKAYTIGSADGTALTLTQKDKVAKDEPVLLYSNTGSDSQTIPAIADGEATVDATNKLVAGDGNTHTYEVGVTEHYILYTGGEKPGFYQANNSLVAEGKAYLDLTGVGGGARIMNFDLFMEDGVATGIAEMKSVNAENSGIFNLRGQRVAQPQKGLYIMNGKKVVVK